jgi:hypothetical protein
MAENWQRGLGYGLGQLYRQRVDRKREEAAKEELTEALTSGDTKKVRELTSSSAENQEFAENWFNWQSERAKQKGLETVSKYKYAANEGQKLKALKDYADWKRSRNERSEEGDDALSELVQGRPEAADLMMRRIESFYGEQRKDRKGFYG